MRYFNDKNIFPFLNPAPVAKLYSFLLFFTNYPIFQPIVVFPILPQPIVDTLAYRVIAIKRQDAIVKTTDEINAQCKKQNNSNHNNKTIIITKGTDV